MPSGDQSREATLLRTVGAWTDPEQVDSDGVADDSIPLALEPGSVIGRYTVLARLGAGAMGVVYEAFDRDLDRRVAVKLLQRGSSDGLLAEAKAMARLAHAHVVSVYDVGTVRLAGEARAFVAMECVGGGTLSDWLAAESRSIDEVLAVFLAAGEGLAAAHRAGLVHRDFKPDNVLMTGAGEAKVTDFGLAHSTQEVFATRERTGPVASVDTRSTLADGVGTGSASMTPTMADSVSDSAPTRQAKPQFCGTPAYMGPELYRGGDATARSDQFSFCVALWEALYGQRPFSGGSLMGLGLAICKDRRNPPPHDVLVPRRVVEVLDRGLAHDPESRFRDMDELLAALRPPVPRRSATGAMAIAAIGVAAGLGLGLALLTREPPPSEEEDPCAKAAASVDDLWSDAARSDLRRVIEASGARDARGMADHVVAEVDAYAAALGRARTRACEQHEARRDSADLEARRAACLDGREQALSGFLDAVTTVDAAQVELLIGAVAKLPALTACEDPERLLAALPPPRAEQAETVARLREELARARTLRAAKASGSVEAASLALRGAEELGYEPLVAEAQLALGRAQLALAHLDEATASLQVAYVSALRMGHDEVATEAAADLLFIVGVERGDTEEGRRWGDHGLALAERGGHARARAQVLSSLATLERNRGQHEQSIAHSREVVELLEAELGVEHLDTGRAYGNYGVALGGAGKMAEALPWLERCAAIYEAKYGANHIRLAPLYSNLGTVRVAVDQLDAAERDLDRALAIHEANASSPKDIGFVRAGLSDLAVRRGDHAAAIEHREFIVDAYRDYFGSVHATVASAELSLATAYLNAGQPARGRPLVDAVAAAAEALGEGAPPELAPRAKMVAGAIAIELGEGTGVRDLAAGWEALQAALAPDPELATWLADHPDADPRRP